MPELAFSLLTVSDCPCRTHSPSTITMRHRDAFLFTDLLDGIVIEIIVDDSGFTFENGFGGARRSVASASWIYPERVSQFEMSWPQQLGAYSIFHSTAR